MLPVKCLKCGSTTGFLMVSTVRHTETLSFDKNVLDVSGKVLTKNKNITCYDCKKVIGKSSDVNLEEYHG